MEPIVLTISPDQEPTEMESLCMNCMKQGKTRILLTSIPYFREIVIFSFNCEHCGFVSNEVQFAGKYEEKGCKITLNVNDVKDLNRQIIKSDFASIKIPELDFEIPEQTQKGSINTIQGVLKLAYLGLKQYYKQNELSSPDVAEKIRLFAEKLKSCSDGKQPFTLILDDISGNSYIENLNAPKEDPKMKSEYYKRSENQDNLLGLYYKEDEKEDE
eukprot:Anaeramoba_ignava/a217563_49.p1 GENE.a217563_49~~a217563_49.p1  ORF type:complete len:215 (+),score=78.98 a217563_49:29-673(+)